MATIANGKNIPLNVRTGTVPDVSGALKDTFQFLTFEPVTKTTTAFQVVERGAPVSFWGNIQPFKDRDLLLKPEGERAWSWYWIFAEPPLLLQVDDVVVFTAAPLIQGGQTRIMARKNYALYGYVLYQAVQDFTGAGPST